MDAPKRGHLLTVSWNKFPAHAGGLFEVTALNLPVPHPDVIPIPRCGVREKTMQNLIKRVDQALDHFWIEIVYTRITGYRVAYHKMASKYYLSKMTRSRGVSAKVEAARMKTRKHAVYAELAAKS